MVAMMVPGDRPIRLVWVDDGLLIRRALVELVSQYGVDVVAEADDVDSALEAVRFHQPDAVVLDVRMPPTKTDEGVQVAVQLRAEGYRGGILVVSHMVDHVTATRLLDRCGPATGYLLKDSLTDPRSLIDSLERVRRGDPVLGPEVVDELMASASARAAVTELSDRERGVLAKMAEGLSNKGIARALFVSERTVDSHVSSIFLKMGLLNEPELHRRVLAVVLFLRAGGGGAPENGDV